MFCKSKIPTPISDLVYRLRCIEEINEQVLERELSNVWVEPNTFENLLRFSNDHYTRVLIYDTALLQVLLLCWNAGQGSLVHDHGVSYCGVRVLAGVATEYVFRDNDDHFQRNLQVGEVVAYPGSFVHKIVNLQKAALVTLHAYAPRLVRS